MYYVWNLVHHRVHFCRYSGGEILKCDALEQAVSPEAYDEPCAAPCGITWSPAAAAKLGMVSQTLGFLGPD